MNKGIAEAARWCKNDVAVIGQLVQDLWDYMEALEDGNEEAALTSSEDFKAIAGLAGFGYKMPPGYWEMLGPEEQFVMTATQALIAKANDLRKKFMDAVLYHMIEDAKAKQEAAKEETA